MTLPLPTSVPTVSPGPYGAVQVEEADLLDELPPCGSARFLVTGKQQASIMAALIRRGCVAATFLRQGAKPEADLFGVVVSRVGADDNIGQVVHQAWRALSPQGGMVAILMDAIRGRASALDVERRLRLHGFKAVQFKMLGTSFLLRATLQRSSKVAYRG